MKKKILLIFFVGCLLLNMGASSLSYSCISKDKNSYVLEIDPEPIRDSIIILKM